MTDGYRREVLNVLLAQLLSERGVISAPEIILQTPGEGRRRMPDVIVDYLGLRTAIEGEIADRPSAEADAIGAARKRVDEGIAHIALAVVYPADLRTAPFGTVKALLQQADLRVGAVTESRQIGYVTATVDALESLLRQTFEHLVKEDIVERAVALLRSAIEFFAVTVVTKAGIVGRAMDALGISELPGERQTDEKEFSVPLGISVRQRNAVSRVTGLVLVNALIFQEILSRENRQIRSAVEIPEDAHIGRELGQCWQDILKINYYPIFHVARKIVLTLGSDHFTLVEVRRLARAAQDLVNMRAPLRHDLMGRVCHRLLADAKYLGTYYTSIPAAALLLKLALRPGAWKVGWHELQQVRRFRVADLACGTGTLLMAAAEAITDNYVSAAAKEGIPIDLPALQAALAEDVLFGYDVLPSALHLTASTLALRAPKITFKKMNLFSLPLGGPELRLGSIEYLGGNAAQMSMDFFGSMTNTKRLTAKTAEDTALAPVPPLDLCVMNPPFTRSVGGNLLFGSVPEDQRRLMQNELKRLVKKSNAHANITAGLGSVFVATAEPYIKEGGRIALVLPKAVLSGVAWQPTRELLARNFRLEYVVASHDPRRWNFSESTHLSEVLLVAAKVGKNSPRSNPRVVALNLWRNLPSVFEALAVAGTMLEHQPPDVAHGQGAVRFLVGEESIGEAVSLPWEELRNQPSWILPCAFAQNDLLRVAYYLAQGILWLPGWGKVGTLPLCPLGELGTLGPDRRGVHNGFMVSREATVYRAYWGHDAKAASMLEQGPNAYLMPRSKAKEGYSLAKTDNLWPQAGRLLIAERLRLNTQSVSAMHVREAVLSNVWWPFSLKKRLSTLSRQKAFALWMNSTLGLLLFLLHREETEGPWVGFKKTLLHAMPTLDLKAFSSAQVKHLASAFDRLSRKALQPFPAMADDRVRAEIDKAVAEALRLPDFSILREMLAREPVVCLKPL